MSSQVIQRDRHAELVAALAITAASLEKFALEIRGLQKTEIGEVEEPFAKGQKGSSAMPHKRNPIGCEQIVGLARVLRGNLGAALENVALWHERDISHSSVERIILPDSFIGLDHMLRRFTRIVAGMVVYPERMRRNLALLHGVIFSGAVLLELARRGRVARAGVRVGAAQRDALVARGPRFPRPAAAPTRTWPPCCPPRTSTACSTSITSSATSTTCSGACSEKARPDAMLDKLKDECGIFGIYGHAESANLTYLGLYALQHRGQESGGIVASDGQKLRAERGMGYVADIFGEQVLAELQGTSAIGHVRYSTAGESRLVNAQPILIDCVHGPIAVCHNGNLVNERELRAWLDARRAPSSRPRATPRCSCTCTRGPRPRASKTRSSRRWRRPRGPSPCSS